MYPILAAMALTALVAGVLILGVALLATVRWFSDARRPGRQR